MERGDREDVQSSHGQLSGPRSEAQQAFGVGRLAALQAGQVTAAAEEIHVKPLQVLLPQEDLKRKKCVKRYVVSWLSGRFVRREMWECWSCLWRGITQQQPTTAVGAVGGRTHKLSNKLLKSSLCLLLDYILKNYRFRVSIQKQTHVSQVFTSTSSSDHTHFQASTCLVDCYTHTHTSRTEPRPFDPSDEGKCFLRRWDAICTTELVFVFCFF